MEEGGRDGDRDGDQDRGPAEGHHSQQIVHLAMPCTDTSKSQDTIAYQIMPHTDAANHGQHIVHLTMPHTQIPMVHLAMPFTPFTDTNHMQPWENCLYCFGPYRDPANHEQRIVYLTCADTGKSQVTKSTPYHFFTQKLKRRGEGQTLGRGAEGGQPKRGGGQSQGASGGGGAGGGGAKETGFCNRPG